MCRHSKRVEERKTKRRRELQEEVDDIVTAETIDEIINNTRSFFNTYIYEEPVKYPVVRRPVFLLELMKPVKPTKKEGFFLFGNNLL